MAVVTLGKKPCHHVTAAAVFLSQGTTINSTIQLGLIREHRLYQIVTEIISFQLAGGRCFRIIAAES